MMKTKQSYHVTVEPTNVGRWHIRVVYNETNSYTCQDLTVCDNYADTPEEAESMANWVIEDHKERRRTAERLREAKLAQTKTWTVKGDL